MSTKGLHVKILDSGRKSWNMWRAGNDNIMPNLADHDLKGRDLRGYFLSNVNFGSADLTGANLSGANLYQAEFFLAELDSADLSNSDLRGAKFHDANLTHASLIRADLYRADFISTRLHRADFTSAQCNLTAFSNVDLSSVVGLSSIVHRGPSSIDSLTLYKSRDPLPLDFLRGVGVPDIMIDYLPAIFNKAIQFYSCFISYSAEDQEPKPVSSVMMSSMFGAPFGAFTAWGKSGLDSLAFRPMTPWN